MFVIHVLSDESVRLHRSVLIYFGHVDVVNEVDKLLGAGRTVVTTCFLFQWFLEDRCVTKMPFVY